MSIFFIHILGHLEIINKGWMWKILLHNKGLKAGYILRLSVSCSREHQYWIPPQCHGPQIWRYAKPINECLYLVPPYNLLPPYQLPPFKLTPFQLPPFKLTPFQLPPYIPPFQLPLDQLPTYHLLPPYQHT